MRAFLMTINILCFVIMTSAQGESSVLANAEQMPYFPGCDQHKNAIEKRKCSDNALIAFISNNLSYPETARSENIQGTVYISFVINEKGYVQDASVIRGLGGGCDEEALKVIGEMPRWEPGIDQGKAVKVKLNLPIQFYLSDEKTDKASSFQINWGNLSGKQVSTSQLEENLSKKLIVRDQNGNELHFSELNFSFEKRVTYLEAASNGSINTKMRKLIRRVKPGGTFTITAVIQQNGELIEVIRSFEVVKA